MDTDYLTPMAYDCLRLAYDAADVLRAEIGAACRQYKNEDEYLQGILEDLKGIVEDPEDYLDSWNLLDETDAGVFVERVRALVEHIEKTIATRLADRGTPDWEM